MHLNTYIIRLAVDELERHAGETTALAAQLKTLLPSTVAPPKVQPTAAAPAAKPRKTAEKSAPPRNFRGAAREDGPRD
jgi:hypothetical protein